MFGYLEVLAAKRTGSEYSSPGIVPVSDLGAMAFSSKP